MRYIFKLHDLVTVVMILVFIVSGCERTSVDRGSDTEAPSATDATPAQPKIHDTELPTITDFNLISNDPTAYQVITFTLHGSDNVGIEYWLVNESSTKPDSDDPAFSTGKPENYTLSSGYGIKTVYVWARDAAGNVGESASLTVSYVEPGTEIWEEKFDGSDGGDDVAYSISFDMSENIYVVGSMESGGDFDWWLKKLDDNGRQINGWDKRRGSDGDDVAYAVAVSPNEPYDVYVAGQWNSSEWGVMKFQPDGTELNSGWKMKRISAGIDASARAVEVDGSGNVYIAGYGDSLVGATGIDWLIKVFKSDGTEITDWHNKTFDGGSGNADQAHAVVFNKLYNRIYFAGYVNDGSNEDWWIKAFEPWAAELDSTNGWDKRIDSGAGKDDRVYGITYDNIGSVFAVGEAGDDWWIMRFAPDGRFASRWNQRFDGGGADAAYSVAVSRSGYVYVAGTAAGGWWIKKFQTDGTEITTGWDKKIPAGGGGAARGVLVDQTGYNIYVVGYGTNLVSAGSGKDWWIKKFFDDRL